MTDEVAAPPPAESTAPPPAAPPSAAAPSAAGPSGKAAAGTTRTTLIWMGVFLVLAVALQVPQDVPFDMDSAYHVAVGQLIRRHGVLTEFPWTRFSIMADRYADKELLFHFLFVPLAPMSPWLACRIVGALLGMLLLTVLHRILVVEKVRHAGFWTLAALAASGTFVLRFATVRPHLLAIPLALVVTWAAARKRALPLFLACALYPLCYTAWHSAIVLALLAATAHALGGNRRQGARVWAALLGGLAFGNVIHPNFPASLHLWWVQNFEVLIDKAWGGAAGFDLGPEFQPFTAGGIRRQMLVPLALALPAAVAAWSSRKRDATPLAFALAALAFLAITLRTQRFMEYAAPFSAVAAALAFREARFRLAGPVLAGLGAIYTSAFAAEASLGRLGAGYELFPTPVAERLRTLIPSGAPVFTCGWGATGHMMLALPERRFMVALDPVFFHRKDPALYKLWYDALHGSPPAHPGKLAHDTFGADFVVCEKSPGYDPFLMALDRTGEGRMIMESPTAVAFVLTSRKP